MGLEPYQVISFSFFFLDHYLADIDPLTLADSTRESVFPLRTSPRRFRDSAGEVCGLSWDKVQVMLPRDPSPKQQNPRWCFSVVYSYLFLTHGLGFGDDHILTVQQSADGSEIGWVLGAAYLEAASTLGHT